MLLGLAPMDGYTDCAFRQITKEIFLKYGEKEKYDFFLWTEFMNADGYIINPIGVAKHLMITQEQSPIIAQIFGGNEEMLTKCFTDIQKKYGKIFSGIELNVGCPARNVMNTGGGGALLKDKENALDIIKKLSKIIKIPFSIKTRTGINDDDKKEQMDFLIKASEYVNMITIHGRTVKQAYTGESDREFIYELKKKANKKCKILGNGGITSYQEIGMKKGNLDGVLIGQSAIGNPRIFTLHVPGKEELKETILKHLNYMIAYEEYYQKQKETFNGILPMPSSDIIGTNHQIFSTEIIICAFRKHLFSYVKGIPGSKEFKQKVSMISDYKQLVEEIQKFFS